MLYILEGRKTNTPAPTTKHWQKKQPQAYPKAIGFIYSASALDCKACPVRSECLAKQTPHRRIWRWEHEAFLQAYGEVMQTESAKAISKRRGAIVAHPFGTIKRSLAGITTCSEAKKKYQEPMVLIGH